MIKGTISLCNKVQVLRTIQYSGPAKRDKIIRQWKRLYKERFYYCWIEISPGITEHINPDGTNGGAKSEEFKFPQKPERPPAEYSNETSLY